MTAVAEDHWSRRLFDHLLGERVTLFTYVPDAGNAALVSLSDAHAATRSVLLTTEEEGVAICAGADLVGERAVLCMQSSGVGNCPNFLSLVKGGRFPLLMIVSMRGDFGEMNPWQYPMGQAARALLAAMGVLSFEVGTASELEPAAKAATAACFHGGAGAALLLSQKFLGAKAF